jgi:riboflavin synthase
MFTGIIEAVGRVTAATLPRLGIGCHLDGLQLGDSIAVNGVCLTVAELGDGRFVADLSEETLARTSLGRLRVGSAVNLERSVLAGGRLGGHIVQGHVDATGAILRLEHKDGSSVFWIELPARLRRYLVEKGSVTVDGVSLTVAEFEDGAFSVALVPHTLAATTLGGAAAGDVVNLEVDILAKYVESLLKGEQT